MKTKIYEVDKAVKYAKKWAYGRNPLYYNFDSLGGDCTNFVSQCIYAGCETMNFQPNGWYYTSLNNRSPAWTGVEFLYNFLINNKGEGPTGTIVNKENVSLGDIVQLGNSTNNFYHTCLVTGLYFDNILLTCHTNDFFNRPLSTYVYEKVRFIHIGQINYV